MTHLHYASQIPSLHEERDGLIAISLRSPMRGRRERSRSLSNAFATGGYCATRRFGAGCTVIFDATPLQRGGSATTGAAHDATPSRSAAEMGAADKQARGR